MSPSLARIATVFLIVPLKCYNAASCVPVISVELLFGVVWQGGVGIQEWAVPSTGRRSWS